MVNKKANFIQLISNLHLSTKRNYLQRMMNDKIKCMVEAKKYEKNYWDGPRKYGYGGYKYIEGRWKIVAKKIIKKFKLNNDSSILDIGCGKGYLLYEIKKILPNINICGIDISKYGIKNAHPKIKKDLRVSDARKKLLFKNKSFDLSISIGCFHNFELPELFLAIQEMIRVSKKHYIAVESYRNERELFNLQCWALTCNSFLSKNEWEWAFERNNFKGSYELIYFP